MASLNSASKTLFVGNLHASLEETDLMEIFSQFGRIVECCKRWCHYGFIQFSSEDEAKQAYASLNGSKVRGRPMRIEFQRKKLRQLQALFDQTSEPSQFSQSNAITNEMCHAFDSSEHMDYFDEKNIEKFFNELMDDSNKQQQQQVKPLGSLDLNASHSTKSTSQQQQQRKLKIRLSLDKENIETTTTTSGNNKKPTKQNSPHPESNFLSPVSAKSPSKKSYSVSSSVMLFRSINNSHTICVEPTDVLEPLNEGDFNEYKLFPNLASSLNETNKKQLQQQQHQHQTSDLKSVLESLQNQFNQIHVLTCSAASGEYTPQSMSSFSCSTASSMHSSISNSPTNFIHF